MRGIHPIRFALILTCLAALSAVCVAQTSSAGGLSNADIVKMMRAGLPESVIVREIRMSGVSLVATPEALIQLKKQGASERILNAVLDSQAGPEAPAPYPMTGAAYGSHPHLPSFQVDVRVKPHQHTTVSVGQNHIAVQKSGVPLFSLTWEPAPPGK